MDRNYYKKLIFYVQVKLFKKDVDTLYIYVVKYILESGLRSKYATHSPH